MKTLRNKLTYANVMATFAVFIALGGASYAAVSLPRNSVGPAQIKKNAVTTAKIKNGAVTGAKVKAGTLGTVPNAAHATTAGTVESLPALEAVHVAALENGCANVNVGLFGPAGYYKDGFGIVHLTGQLQGCTKNSNAFVLPPGFRPSVATIHAVPDQVQVGAEIEVLPSGAVVPFGTNGPSLGGITFRAS